MGTSYTFKCEKLDSVDEFQFLVDSFNKCPECGGEKFKPWNLINKKCPKYGGKVSRFNGGMIICFKTY